MNEIHICNVVMLLAIQSLFSLILVTNEDYDYAVAVIT
ncbi:hypothetical protein SRABI27_01950 [Pedobacter sp. Bi27]|nr:hypothetical protein SRABI27_01950 [Pedobacter sp. Bi27]